jgi:hypothetical protein
MNRRLGAYLVTGTLLAGVLWLSGCNEPSTVGQATAGPLGTRHRDVSTRSLASGTSISVALGNTISSEHASVGDVWHGTVTENVMNGNESVIPPGSEVEGIVTAVTAAERGSRAMLDLGVRRIMVNGHYEGISATTESVIAGSPRARNLGAIAGSAAVGAAIGRMVGDGKNGTVGALIGGAAATGVVASSKGYQVVLKDGTVIVFTVSQTVAMR